MSREVVWFHGAELLKTLSEVVLPEDPDRPAKHAALQEWLAELRVALERLAPDPTGQPWLDPILRFYRPLTTGDRHDAA